MTTDTCTIQLRRKDWGTLEDFLNYYSYLDHIISITLATCDTPDIYHATISPFGPSIDHSQRNILAKLKSSHEDKSEAFRISVEKFIAYNEEKGKFKDRSVYLPWKPDYDLSTIEGCKQAIEESGWQIANSTESKLVVNLRHENGTLQKSIERKYEPPLVVWQSIAQRAILNATK